MCTVSPLENELACRNQLSITRLQQRGNWGCKRLNPPRLVRIFMGPILNCFGTKIGYHASNLVDSDSRPCSFQPCAWVGGTLSQWMACSFCIHRFRTERRMYLRPLLQAKWYTATRISSPPPLKLPPKYPHPSAKIASPISSPPD